MKKAISVFSGLVLAAVLGLSVLGQTSNPKPMSGDTAQSKTTSAKSAKHSKKKKSKKSHSRTSNSTGEATQAAKTKH